MALSMGYGLYQEQRMKLVMTPELRQAINVLQYSAQDLVQYIQEQVTENPVLEVNEDMGHHGEVSEEMDQWADWTAYLRNGQGAFSTPLAHYDPDGQHPVDHVADIQETLSNALESQLRYLHLPPETMQICRYLIGSLNEDGYLEHDLQIICKRFNAGVEEVEACLEIIQTLDPAGVGARNLEECLRIQLLRKETLDETALAIVTHCLTDLGEGRYRKVARQLGFDVTEVQRATDQIRKLNPKPGSAFGSGPPRYVRPDVMVQKVGDEYEVTVNESHMPRLFISPHYERMLRLEDDKSRQAATYLKNRLQSALWLLRSIEQRHSTLTRVTKAIVEEQKSFFDKGITHLKPLTLRQIAETLDLHESTVSRATQHKYIQTPRGLYPYRFFFPSGVSTRYGDHTSASSVKDQITRLITEEHKRKPLSDQKIADILKEKGVRISRRTVAKYREELGIGSSTQRRRYDGE
ncbi:RNA polymerase factor sigma-54 [Kroppenstedtia pulmonis]|uniref:RNA polymerase factor sigma-54 n=1 Tax=Kroppenstedtia pulmonis TaxID=1380685 RepID=A0A7D3Y2Z7_9BACL|nr:RNA polymerase factor sigma-54 [Kroppenstedtia pulmonis]QKG83225.1 RNA polymerase factor sigma-54 [Kroppenstedtia pulmonis]